MCWTKRKHRNKESEKKNNHPLCSKCGREMVLERSKRFNNYTHWRCFICGKELVTRDRRK